MLDANPDQPELCSSSPPSTGELWDVLVIGAGPAGASAACQAATAGLQVLLVDAKAFPRRKACGGCLNQVSQQLLTRVLGDAHPVWASALRLDRFACWHTGQPLSFDLPASWAIDREQLDLALVRRAVDLGCTFRDSTRGKLSGVEAAARRVELRDSGGVRMVRARTVVLASGLGQRAAHSEQALQSIVSAHSRVGVEAIFDEIPACYPASTISMAIDQAGYVGLTPVCGQRLHVAAAVDREALQRQGPAALITTIIHRAGLPALPDAAEGIWRGTPPLSARPTLRATQRVFVVGDAAGYVEPFTGEGIRWAVESGMGVVPWLVRAARSQAWDEAWARQWQACYELHISRRQRLCRAIAWGLRRGAVRWLAMQALRLHPGWGHTVIAHLNSPSKALVCP